MNPIWPIAVGVVAGIIAKLLTSGTGPGGLLIKPLVGVAGAFAGVYLLPSIGLNVNSGEAQGILAPALGAVLFLVIQHLFTKTGLQ